MKWFNLDLDNGTKTTSSSKADETYANHHHHPTDSKERPQEQRKLKGRISKKIALVEEDVSVGRKQASEILLLLYKVISKTIIHSNMKE